MDPLDFLTQEQLIKFFHCKKTEISCIEEPSIFLRQLRDHNLVPEDLYKNVIKRKSKKRLQEGVYEILDRLENKPGQCVKLFWRCVFQDHIMLKYSLFYLLRKSLLDGSFDFDEKLPDTEELNNNQKEERNIKEKKIGGKRKKSVEETEEVERDPGPSSCSTPTQRKPTKLTFTSPVKKGKKADIWTWELYKTNLPVTCGATEGTLHRGKMAKGMKCILSNGVWYSPTEFEKFAGRGSWKNWKSSIRCQKTPLHKLIQEGHLQCTLMKKHRGRKSQRVLFTESSSESSESESSEETEGSGEDQQEERENEDVEEEEEQESEEELGPEDLLEFEAEVLPVRCGSVTGHLYKNRFTGSRSKSIRTEERWFTPEEFLKQNVTLTDGRWKRDILCHERNLNILWKNKILSVHSLLCACSLCHPEVPLAQNNDDVCFICNSSGDLACCDECPRSFHQDCHLPDPHKDTHGGKWACTFCIWKLNQELWISMSLEDALNCPITNHIMRCEYLLLCVYKDDTQRLFTDDPVTTMLGYSSVITNPMWLNRVKDKLMRNVYRTVGQFVKDIRLIFQNCHTFSTDNSEVDVIGVRLSEHFEQNFRSVFKIQ